MSNKQKNLEYGLDKAKKSFVLLKKKTISLLIKIKSYDKITVAISALQFFSSYTTVRGASIILSKSPNYLPWVLGLGLQGILILLLIFKEKNQSIFRRWFSIFWLTLFSIYTSFFSLYDDLLGGMLTEESSHKVTAYEELRRSLYTPYLQTLQQLREEKHWLENTLEEEERGERGRAG